MCRLHFSTGSGVLTCLAFGGNWGHPGLQARVAAGALCPPAPPPPSAGEVPGSPLHASLCPRGSFPETQPGTGGSVSFLLRKEERPRAGKTDVRRKRRERLHKSTPSSSLPLHCKQWCLNRSQKPHGTGRLPPRAGPGRRGTRGRSPRSIQSVLNSLLVDGRTQETTKDSWRRTRGRRNAPSDQVVISPQEQPQKVPEESAVTTDQ